MERSTVNTLLIFSILLVIYNALFVMYCICSYFEKELPGLLAFIPLLCLLIDTVMTVFALLFLRLSNTMVTLLTDDFQTQVRFLQAEVQRR